MQTGYFFHHVVANLRIQRRERLIEQQHPRANGNGSRNGDALLLAAGEAGAGSAWRTRPCPTIFNASVTRSPIDAFGCFCARRPKATLSSTFICGNRA